MYAIEIIERIGGRLANERFPVVSLYKLRTPAPTTKYTEKQNNTLPENPLFSMQRTYFRIPTKLLRVVLFSCPRSRCCAPSGKGRCCVGQCNSRRH